MAPAGSRAPTMRAPVARDPVTALPWPAARLGGRGSGGGAPRGPKAALLKGVGPDMSRPWDPGPELGRPILGVGTVRSPGGAPPPPHLRGTWSTEEVTSCICVGGTQMRPGAPGPGAGNQRAGNLGGRTWSGPASIAAFPAPRPKSTLKQSWRAGPSEISSGRGAGAPHTAENPRTLQGESGGSQGQSGAGQGKPGSVSFRLQTQMRGRVAEQEEKVAETPP